MQEEDRLSLREAADALGVSEVTARRWIKSDKLKAYQPGRKYLIPRSAVDELLESESPKVESSSLELSLFNGLESERRESVYGPWLEFVNDYADQWEERIEAGDLDLGSINEFIRVCDHLVPVLTELNALELREFPVEVSDTFGGHEAITGRAIWRLFDLLNPMAQAGGAMFADSELEQLRRRREDLGQLRQAANG